MKKCPSCDKIYEDSMRFCQVDGTPLVDDAPPLDPYKTIVARPINISESEPASPAGAQAPPVFQASAPAIEEPEDLLDLPASDPLKTMYVSDDEMRKAMSGRSESGDLHMEIPMREPEPPRFSEPEIPSPTFSDLSPASTPENMSRPDIGSTAPSIPSPFDAPVVRPSFSEPVQPEPSYNESATVIQDFPPASPFGSPDHSFVPPAEPYDPAPPLAPSVPSYEQAPLPAEPAFKEPEPYRPAAVSPFQPDNSPAAWTPPPAPEASWQNQEIGQNTPFQPPAAGGGVNQTLPIISLVLGIASLCCYVSPITGIAALVTGYLGLKNIKTDSHNFGGRGLAIAGMVTGGLFLLLGLVYWILMIVGIGLGSLGR